MPQNFDHEGLTACSQEKNRFVNHRRTVRYIRKDITASVYKSRWLDAIGIDWFRTEIPVELLDISNRGCLIACPKPWAVEAKIVVVLQFETGKRFEIKAAVVRKAEGRDLEYGIKFAVYNDALGDYMLKTQNELTFK